jgi:RND family efflux transporter MFP subunit
MKRKPILYAGAFGVAIVLVGSLIHETARAPIRVTYAQVTSGAVAREIFTTGTLEPARTVNVGTQISGTIQTLEADFNSRVTKGQIIARLDPSLYDLQVTQARATLIQADAALAGANIVAEDAKVKLERARALAGQELITQAELDAARLTSAGADAIVKSSHAALRLAKAQLTEAEVTRARTIIRSPIDGVVINRAVEIGQTLAASFQSPVLFTIADLRQMRLIAEVSEGDVGGVRPGTPVTFELSSLDGKEFEGTVAEVRLQPIATLGNTSTATTGAAATSGTAGTSGTTGAPTANAPSGPSTTAASSGSAGSAATSPPATQPVPAGATTGAAGAVVSYEAIVPVENPDGRLPPGSTVVVTMPVNERSNVVRIPNKALAFRPSREVFEAINGEAPKFSTAGESEQPSSGRTAHVWKYERGQFVVIPVKTAVSDDQWTELLSGPIQPGDELVTDVKLTRGSEPES